MITLFFKDFLKIESLQPKLHSILFFLSNDIFADYSEHPEAKEVIETLVSDHGFEKSYVIQILQSAKKQETIRKILANTSISKI